jgi:hypothetical protein
VLFSPNLLAAFSSLKCIGAEITMSEKKNSTVGLQIEAPSPTPEKYNYDEEANLPK